MTTTETRRRALQALIDRRFGGVQSRFGTAIGRQSDYVSRIVTGKKNIGERLAREIEAVLQLEPGELDREPNLSDGITSVPFARLTGSVPVVTWESLEACLGGGKEEMAAAVVMFHAPRPSGLGEGVIGVQVQGSAMEPEFRDGWVVYVDAKASVKHGDFIIAKQPDERVPRLRQLVIDGDQRYLQALNPQHPERLVVFDEKGVILGRVCFQGKKY